MKAKGEKMVDKTAKAKKKSKRAAKKRAPARSKAAKSARKSRSTPQTRKKPRAARTSRFRAKKSVKKQYPLSAKKFQRVSLKTAKQENFEPLEYFSKPVKKPELELPPADKKFELPITSASRRVEAKKRIPPVATALIGSIIITVLSAALLTVALGLDLLYAAGICTAVFVGFSILLYNFLVVNNQ